MSNWLQEIAWGITYSTGEYNNSNPTWSSFESSSDKLGSQFASQGFLFWTMLTSICKCTLSKREVLMHLLLDMRLALRGGIKKIKLVFFRKTPKFWDPPTPPLSNSEAPFFSDKEISELARPPPPFWRKIPKYSQFFFITSLWIGWEPPFWRKYPNIPIFYDNTLLE